MKLLLYGQNKNEVEKLAEEFHFEIVASDPDIIAVCGGDGTLMKSEKEFPGIPKFIIRKSKTTKKGHDLSEQEMLERLSRGRYKINEELKIVAAAKGQEIIGLNEIIVHNADPRQAIRYTIHVDGKQIGNEIIGDGVIMATPFGSTGYYRSITGSFFEVGIGVAFNNSTEQSDHMVLREEAKISVKIVRGKALAYADNSNEEIELHDGDEISIYKNAETAKIIVF